MCVSQTEGARLGSRGWGHRRPMSQQDLAEGRGPEDSRPTLEAEGLGGTVLGHLGVPLHVTYLWVVST